MEYTLYWNSDEEGLLTFLDYDKTEWLCFDIFVLGEEAELVIKSGSIVDKCKKVDSIRGKVFDRLEDCVWKACSLLWDRGMEEVFFVDKQGKPLMHALKEYRSSLRRGACPFQSSCRREGGSYALQREQGRLP